MVSFNKLGQFGRLGNQLFQYAFLRTTATRLRTKFYCPHWVGDEIFDLKDSSERSKELIGIEREYKEPFYFGLNNEALEIQDNTNIEGYFQTASYFNASTVKGWYVFKEEQFSKVKLKYGGIDFKNTVGVHIRFNDEGFTPLQKSIYYLPNKDYYNLALCKIKQERTILVFSDSLKKAMGYLRKLKKNLVFIDGNRDWEDFFLLSRCKDLICSASTFCWWAAFLNIYQDKKIIVPQEGPLRTGSPFKNNEYWPHEYMGLKALNWPFNSFKIVFRFQKLIPRFNLRK